MTILLSSMTRISDLAEGSYQIAPLPRSDWTDGQYVALEMERSSASPDLELANGRMMQLMQGDQVVGALGVRHATLEAVGDWRSMTEDMRLDLMTAGGMIGKITSRSPFASSPISGRYRGHVVRDGAPLNMSDYVAALPPRQLTLPAVLIVGTSMSAGKTMSGRAVVRELRERGFRVAGAKFTGAGRFRDVLSLGDAGADFIFDFVDVGLPSTVCDDATYRRAFAQLTTRIEESGADVLVCEAGASPLEPYQGALAVQGLADQVRLTILAASDPYAVLGVMQAFKSPPDLVTGPASNTSAGRELIAKLTGLKAANLFEEDGRACLHALLDACFPHKGSAG